VSPDCDLSEALRLLMSQRAQHMVLITSEEGDLEGILTKADVLSGSQSTQPKWRPLNARRLGSPVGRNGPGSRGQCLPDRWLLRRCKARG
jgi:hypothetical protein